MYGGRYGLAIRFLDEWFIKTRKISGQASCEAPKIYNTHVTEYRADNVARESTRTRCLNSAIYQTLLSSEPFHVAINVSTAGTSYFKALWHRHAHAKFASRRVRITLASSPRASLYRTDPAIYRLCRGDSIQQIRNENRIGIEHDSIDITRSFLETCFILR